MIRLSRKFIKRSIVGLALLAPIVYLFGSLFTALNGSHGEKVFAQDNTPKSIHVSSSSFTRSRLPSSTYPILSSIVYNEWATFFFSMEAPFTISNDMDNFPVNGRMRLYMFDDNFSQVSDTGQTGSGSIVYTGVYKHFAVSYYSITDVNALVELDTTITPHGASNYIEGVSYSDYIFGQFFASDNFLSEWGEDAISDTPHGFAPFGVLLKTIDENVLHLSDEQIGLMAYGYFYYCAHVLIFAFVFECATFFISWCSSIFNKFGGKDNGD